MPLDDLFDYLRRCGGSDTLVFDTPAAASHARDIIQGQLEQDGVDFSDFPSLDLFDSSLRIRLKEKPRASQPVAEVAEVF